MSFILDALKKSESDRQRKSHPENAYLAAGSGNSRPAAWVWVVGGLLAVNVAVLLFFMLRPGPAVQPGLPAETQEAPMTDGAMSQAQKQAAESRTFREIVADVRDKPDVAAEPEPAAATPVQRAQPRAAAPATDHSRPSTDTVAYPTFNEARVNGNVSLPDLHLDIHVYSEKTSERFVFVNMSKYKEKATLDEGPTVFEIVPDGVILEYSGTRFLLPRE